MRAIIQQALCTALCVATIYGSLVLLSFWVYPASSEASLDTGSAERTIYATPTKYLYFGRTNLGAPSNVFLVGASNVDAGLRPLQVKEHVPCAKVHNLSVGGMNASEMQQTVDLVQAVAPPPVFGRETGNTFVFGIWYGDFGDSADRWKDGRPHAETDLEVELYRFGFYHRGPDGPQPTISSAWLPLESIALRPFHMLEGGLRRISEKARERLFVRPRFLTLDEREARVFQPAEKTQALSYWHQQLGRRAQVSADQFATFDRMIAKTMADGNRVLVIDLPIPHWHASASPYEPSYRHQLASLVAKYSLDPRFAFLDMPDLDREEGYSDEVHPKPSLAKLWAKRTGDAINALACPIVRSAQK